MWEIIIKKNRNDSFNIFRLGKTKYGTINKQKLILT